MAKVKVFSATSVPLSGPVTGGAKPRILVSEKDTNLFFMGMGTLEPGKGHAWHYVEKSDEAMYILKGEGTISWKEKGTIKSHKYKEGDVIFIPKGTPHHNMNTGKETVTLISIIAPYAVAVQENSS